MNKQLTLLPVHLPIIALFSTFISSCSVEEYKDPPLPENYILGENSLRDYIIPKIKSLDIEKLKELEYRPAIFEDSEGNKNLDSNEFVLDIHRQSIPKKFYKDMGFMWGRVRLLGSSNQFGKWVFKPINMDFVKFDKNESWKLITYGGYVENVSENIGSLDDDLNRIIKDKHRYQISPEVHTYIKSIFQTIDEYEYNKHINYIKKQESLSKGDKATP